MKTPREVVQEWVAAYNQRDARAGGRVVPRGRHELPSSLRSPERRQAHDLGRLALFFRAFPDNFTHVENLFEDGEWAFLEWFGGGTWRGEFARMAPNGRSFTLRGRGFFYVTGGKIGFQRGYFDKATWFAQLGIPLA